MLRMQDILDKISFDEIVIGKLGRLSYYVFLKKNLVDRRSLIVRFIIKTFRTGDVMNIIHHEVHFNDEIVNINGNKRFMDVVIDNELSNIEPIEWISDKVGDLIIETYRKE